MSKSSLLRLREYRLLHDLAADCRELGEDPAAWRYRLAEGVGRLTGAAIACVLEHGDDGMTWAGYTEWGWETSGFDRKAADRLKEVAAAETPLINPMVVRLFEVQAHKTGAAVTCRDLVSNEEFHQSRFYEELHGPTGADAQLSCLRPMTGPATGTSNITLVRPRGAPDFDRRHRAIVEHANLLVAPLIGGPLARYIDPSPVQLSPRARQVLRCMLEGDSDKQIALRLSIGRYTVNQYAKAIYRHFGVQSRPELLARWIRRGWGAKFAWADV